MCCKDVPVSKKHSVLPRIRHENAEVSWSGGHWNTPQKAMCGIGSESTLPTIFASHSTESPCAQLQMTYFLPSHGRRDELYVVICSLEEVAGLMHNGHAPCNWRHEDLAAYTHLQYAMGVHLTWVHLACRCDRSGEVLSSAECHDIHLHVRGWHEPLDSNPPSGCLPAMSGV